MDQTKILVGAVKFYIAPTGTAVPDFTVSPVVPAVGWVEVGFTQDGVDFSYQPSFKDSTPDESLSPVKKTLTGEKASIGCTLLEATAANMAKAIAASKTTVAAAGLAQVGSTTVKVGGGVSTEVMAMMIGKSAAGFELALVGYRAVPMANVKQKFAKASEVVIPVEFELLADPSKPAGEQLYELVEITAQHT